MTPREFAEHVETETVRLLFHMEALADRICSGDKSTGIDVLNIMEAVGELSSLARQHAIEQERNG